MQWGYFWSSDVFSGVSGCLEFGNSGEHHTSMALHGWTGQTSRCPMSSEWGSAKSQSDSTLMCIILFFQAWIPVTLKVASNVLEGTLEKKKCQDWQCFCFPKVSGWLGRPSGTPVASCRVHALWQWPGLLWRFVYIYTCIYSVDIFRKNLRLKSAEWVFLLQFSSERFSDL